MGSGRDKTKSLWGKRSAHPSYRSWSAMHERCYDTKQKAFPRYGGRGITVCHEWLCFEKFVNDMGPRPSKDHSIDRINNNLGYFKENCRWATRKEQSANRRLAYECINGHPWTDVSTKWRWDGNKLKRRCIICLTKYERKRILNRKKKIS